MQVNLWAVLVCAILSMVIGAIWYGPIFGKKWMKLVGLNFNTPEEIKAMQKSSGPLYAVQFILSLFQAYVLAHYIIGWKEASGLENSLWIFSAFILPMIIGNNIWNNYSKKDAWDRIFIQTGYQLILFIVFGIILGNWR